MHGAIANFASDWRGGVDAGACAPAAMQAAAQEALARTHEACRNSLATAQGTARVFTIVAETTWGSAKLLSDRLLQNLAINTDAAFSAAQSIAAATSPAEVARLQGEFVQRFLEVAGEQARELVDLSARAAQHVLETTEAAVSGMLRVGPEAGR
jgi:hypothetical protein